MRRAEWLVERPWRLVVLVLLIAAPLLVLGEVAASDTQRRVEAEQRENLRSLALRGAEATATRTGTLLDKLVGAASTSRLKSAIGWAFSREPGGPREIIEPPDTRELSFQLDTFHAVMRDEVATLFALDGAGFVLETDPPGGTADGRVRVNKDLRNSAYATAVIANHDPRYVGVDPGTGSLVFAVPVTQVLTQNPATQRTARGTPAALVAEVRPAFLESSLRSLSVSVGDLDVVDGEGRLLARLNGESRPLQDLRRHPAVAAALAGGSYLDRSSDPISNAPALVATAPVGVLGWHVVAVAREDALRAEIDVGLAQQRGLRVGLIAVLLIGAVLVGGASSAAIRRRRETAEALAQQTAVAEVLKSIGASGFDLGQVLQTVTEHATRLSGATQGILYRRDREMLHFAAGFGPSEELMEFNRGTPIAVGDRGTLTGRVAIDKRTIHLADVLQDSEYTYVEAQRLGGFRAMLGVPLMSGDDLIGAMSLWRTEPVPFSEGQIAVVETFARQAAVAIQNVRLFNETKEALEQQTAVGEVLKTISRSAFDLEPVLNIVLNNAVRLAGADIGWLSRVESEQFMTVAYSSEFPERVRKELIQQRAQGHVAGPWVPVGARGGVMGFTLAEGRTVHVADLKEDEKLKGSVVARLTESRTVVGVPMIREGRSIGAMVLARYQVRPFGERELDLVQTFADQAAIAIENVRLFNETKEALERQTAVAQVLGEISQSGFELGPVLETVIEHATELCAAQQGFIYRKDGDVYRLAVAHGITAEFKAFTEANPVNPMGRGTVTGRVVHDRTTVHVPDVLSDPEYTYWEAQRLGNFRALLGVPMIRDDDVIGVMLLWRTEPQPFTDEQITLVTTFAHQATIAIENVRLFDETKVSLEQQTATADVLKVISRSVFDLPAVLHTVVESAARLADADVAWLNHAEGEQSRVGTFYGRTADLQLRVDAEMSAVMPVGGLFNLDRRTATSRAILDRQVVHVADITMEPDLQKSGFARAIGARAVLAVPLIRERTPIGALALARLTPRAFTDREIALVQTFADQAVIAIENVRLFNETKESLERQTAISEVLETINSSAFDLQPIFDRVLERAAGLCDADFAWMNLWEPDGTHVRIAAVTTRIPDLADFARSRPVGQVIAAELVPSQEITRQALRGELIHRADITADPELFEASASVRRVGGRGVLATPMTREQQTVGALVLVRRRVGAFSEREVQLVRTFAGQAVIALENVRLFNEIRNKSRELEVAGRHKSEFLANMSHELRTPLNAIIGFSEVLLQGIFGEVNEKQREYLQDVLGSGQHLLSLINDILDLSKIEAGRMELELSTFSFGDALESGLTIVRERASRHNITLSVASDELGMVEADERKVKQIFYNLLSNAVKFTPDGGRVDVTARRDNADVRVDVRDNGIGIAEADQGRIFDEFQQVGRERSREGTGLGLTLTKRFVELHGGRIWLESAPGKGSTFAFTLPLRQAAPVRV